MVFIGQYNELATCTYKDEARTVAFDIGEGSDLVSLSAITARLRGFLCGIANDYRFFYVQDSRISS